MKIATRRWCGDSESNLHIGKLSGMSAICQSPASSSHNPMGEVDFTGLSGEGPPVGIYMLQRIRRIGPPQVYLVIWTERRKRSEKSIFCI